METLLTKLQREEREKHLGVNTDPHDAWHTSIYEQKAQMIDEIVAHTLKQAAEEFLQLIDKHDPNVKMGRETNPAYWGNTLRADAQKLLLGEDNENDV